LWRLTSHLEETVNVLGATALLMSPAYSSAPFWERRCSPVRQRRSFCREFKLEAVRMVTEACGPMMSNYLKNKEMDALSRSTAKTRAEAGLI
jgi:hypothetical protein